MGLLKFTDTDLTMKAILFSFVLLFGLCVSLPTGAPGPFIIDLTGGAGQPGQVIGQVDGGSFANHVPPADPGLRVVDPPLQPPPAPIPTLSPLTVDAIHVPLPNIIAVDPVQPPADPAPNLPPVDAVVYPAPSDPANQIPVDPILHPPPHPAPSEPMPQPLPADPVKSQGPPNSVSYPLLPVPADPAFPADPVKSQGPPNSVSYPLLPVPADPAFPADPVKSQGPPNSVSYPLLPAPAEPAPYPSPFDPNPAAVNTANVPTSGGLNPPANAIDWTCEGYRAHSSSPNMYQVFYNNQWSDYSCFGILVWNQTLCSCLVPADTGEVDPNCPNNKAHLTDPALYHIKHWGVWITKPKRCPPNQLWNQTGCRCDWDPVGPGGVFDAPVGGICDLMFNATFTSSLRDDANYNSIGREPWFNVKVENGTARLENGRMPVWAFAGNHFGTEFQVQTDFSVDNIPANANLYTTLVSNDCEYDRASVSVSYRPVDQSYKVFFRDSRLNSTLQCTAPTITPYAVQSISLEYQSSRLCLKVNGVMCVESHDFGGDVAISRCPFYFGGDGRQQYMTGNLDDIRVRRFCVFPV